MNWYDWNVTILFKNQFIFIMSGLICMNWYDWNLIYFEHICWQHFVVGIDLHELIRLKHSKRQCLVLHSTLSGLICMNWYDWNNDSWNSITHIWIGRDWSAWIDTIETEQFNVMLWTVMKCRDWSAWIDTIETRYHEWTLKYFTLSGLICMNWYDWNTTKHRSMVINTNGRDWSAWIDTIETTYAFIKLFTGHLVGIDLHELIRLKPGTQECWERLLVCLVGIDLHELIRLKPYLTPSNPSSE